MVAYLLPMALLSATPAPVAEPAPAEPAAIDIAPVEIEVVAPPPVVMVDVPASNTLPEAVRTLIRTAIAEHDDAALAAIVKMARKAYPDNRGAITSETASHDAAAEVKRKADEQARLARLANPNPLANWKGEVELGASRATGNTRNLALYASIKAEREGLRWNHSFNFRGDFQTTEDVTTTERILASWQPKYKVDDSLYGYGLGQFEHDRFLGISSRETAATGIGYSVVNRPAMKLDFEGGPALRRTNFSDQDSRTTLAGRASVKFRWTINPNLQVTQDASMFVERANNNASATTALETKLLGALKAKFSYNVQYEQQAPDRRETIDTLSRATLVYSF